MKLRFTPLVAALLSFSDNMQRLRNMIDYVGRNRLDLARIFFVSVLVGCFAANPALAVPGRGPLLGFSGGDGDLLFIGAVSGAASTIGAPLGFPAPALARDPLTGTLYAGEGGGDPKIYTVDVATGVATLVGDSGLGFAAISSLDFDSSGVLFAAVNIAGDGGTGADHLATIDTSDGTATLIGPFGICAGVPSLPVSGSAGSCDLEGIEGIAFDSAGQLWGVKSTRGVAGSPGLYID